MKRTAKILLLILGLAASTLPLQAEPKPNVDKDGLALEGYDPVAFFTDGKPVMGKEEFHSSFKDATYRFASAEHKAMFEKEPAKYEPEFGGYCTTGVAQGHLAPVKIDAFQIVNGRLILQYNEKAKAEFNKDPEKVLGAAKKNWPTLKKDS